MAKTIKAVMIGGPWDGYLFEADDSERARNETLMVQKNVAGEAFMYARSKKDYQDGMVRWHYMPDEATRGALLRALPPVDRSIPTDTKSVTIKVTPDAKHINVWFGGEVVMQRSYHPGITHAEIKAWVDAELKDGITLGKLHTKEGDK